MSNKMRYIIVMILGIAMNKLFFAFGQTLNLPVWLDVTGTALVALTLEPAAGLLVGLIDSFYLAIFEYHDASTLIYYSISAVVVLAVGVGMRKNGKIHLKRVVPVIGIVILGSALLATVLTMWRAGGISNNAWEIIYYQHAIAFGAPPFLACFWGALLVKTFDTLATAVLVGLTYYFMPAALKLSPKEKSTLAK